MNKLIEDRLVSLFNLDTDFEWALGRILPPQGGVNWWREKRLSLFKYKTSYKLPAALTLLSQDLFNKISHGQHLVNLRQTRTWRNSAFSPATKTIFIVEVQSFQMPLRVVIQVLKWCQLSSLCLTNNTNWIILVVVCYNTFLLKHYLFFSESKWFGLADVAEAGEVKQVFHFYIHSG